MSKNKNINRLLQISIIVGVFIFAFSGLAYIYRLRTALNNSTESYKATIVEFEERVQQLEEKNSGLKDEVFAQGTELTNSVSASYELEINPSDLSLNDVFVENEKIDFVRFIVGGHLYGAPSNEGDVTPAQTLINAVPEINRLSPNLFFVLGDLAQYPSEQSFHELHANFLDKIHTPVFNAPGNHDFDNGRIFYEKEFGQTFYFFKYAQNQIIILDTEIASCFIIANQKEMLEQAIDIALADEAIENIFVFFHKVLFLDLGINLREKANGACKYGNNYIDLQDDLFFPTAQIKPVYLIAGDVGAFGGNLSPFYNKYPDADLYTLAVGLGDAPEDILLQIDIRSAEVKFQILPIGGYQFSPIETYTPEYWAAP